MTNQDQDLTKLRIRVAELLGWEDFCYRPINLAFDKFVGWPPGATEPTGKHLPVPDYPNDLNACHAFEEPLHCEANGDKWNQYSRALSRICAKAGYDPVHATAEQRCRAFVALHDAQEAR